MQAGREELEVVFLGTGAALPSKYRNVTATYLNFFGKVMAMPMPCYSEGLGGVCRPDACSMTPFHGVCVRIMLTVHCLCTIVLGVYRSMMVFCKAACCWTARRGPTACVGTPC